MDEFHDPGMKDELDILLDWLKEGHACAMATVLATWGSSPRPVGSVLAVREDGLFEGSVSGGCVEGAVIEAALEAIADGRPRDLSFGVGDGQAWDVGLACGGKIRIYVERMETPQIAVLDVLHDFRAARKASVRAVVLGKPFWSIASVAPGKGSYLIQSPEGYESFFHLIEPPPRLFILGAVHIAQFLAPMARMVGFEVHIVDPRTAFASEDRFADTPLIRQWPNEAFATWPLDEHSALVTLTHDPKLDDVALAGALRSRAFHIAALGSRRTQAARLERLASEGFGENDLRRINGPAGLAIGAISPAEIALSILAQLVAARRLGSDR